MKLKEFRVLHYRNIIDSGWVRASDITALVGQNECGKSNLLKALYKLNPFGTIGPEENRTFDLDEDWPIDEWGDDRKSTQVACETKFVLDKAETEDLVSKTMVNVEKQGTGEATEAVAPLIPESLEIFVSKDYDNKFRVDIPDESFLAGRKLDPEKLKAWVASNLPKCVYMDDLAIFCGQTDINALNTKVVNRSKLSEEEETVIITLKLASLDLGNLVSKGGSEDGRRQRGKDTVAAAWKLTHGFVHKWKQKPIKFHMRVDATTFDVLVEDEGLGSPVALKDRSRGFQWFVSFIWRFMFASKGDFKNCILLLDEPGIHLHHAGHLDLLEFFESLKDTNQVVYTTHLATLLDLAYPERIRIMEVEDHHAKVIDRIVSSQKEPMMVIEAALGLSGNMSGLLGTRQNLIVEGVDELLVLQKLSGVLNNSGDKGLSESIYLIPAHGASKTPTFASFLIGHGFDAGVLLDSDPEGEKAKRQIKDQAIDKVAGERGAKFKVLMLGEGTGSSKREFAIEDLFSTDYYLDCANEAYRTNLKTSDLPEVTDAGSDQNCKKVEAALEKIGQVKELDKRRVMNVIQRRFDKVRKKEELPQGTFDVARKLFEKINAAFSEST